MKIMVLLRSTSVEKDSDIVTSLFFSHFLFGILWPPFFSHMGQCSNDYHHTFIDLQLNDYNSILEQSMTLCLRWCTGICNEPRVTCMKEL